MTVFVRSIFVAVLVALSALPVQAATNTPMALVNAFYAEYLRGNHRDDAWLKTYLAADTYALYERAEERNKSGDLVLDYDPFGGTQDRAYFAKVQPSTSAHGETVVPVRIGCCSKAHPQWDQMDVVVRNIGHHWVIWNFIAYDKGKVSADFRKQTIKNLTNTPH